jgi:hypothetical protein
MFYKYIEGQEYIEGQSKINIKLLQPLLMKAASRPQL